MTVTIHYGSPQDPQFGVTPYRSLVRFTQPAVEPVTLSEAKSHCRVDTSADDAYISTLIAAARTYCEDILDLCMVDTVLEARYDSFPIWELVLPRPPMRPLAVTVTYRDEGGVTRTLASNQYQTDTNVTPGRIFPLYGGVWPAVRGDENSVVVRWTAGYGASGLTVPSTLKHAILLLVAHWYAMREPVTPGNAAPVPNTFNTLLAASGWGGYR